MDQGALEGLAEGLYREAGLDPAEAASPVDLARSALGDEGVQVVPPGALRFTSAQLATIEGKRRIFVRRGDPAQMTFAIAHELAHWALEREGYCEQDEEDAANYLGAALVATRSAFRRTLRAVGEDLGDLAEEFGSTESLCLLRLGETTGRPLALVRPGLVRVRGQLEFIWPAEETLRGWASGRAPAGVVKTRGIDGDHRRVALMFDEVGS